MVNWVFILVPHFPEENEQTQSDCVGKKSGKNTIFLISNLSIKTLFSQLRTLLFCRRQIGSHRFLQESDGQK